MSGVIKSYRTAQSFRRSRYHAPVVHAVLVERVKIGNNYKGEPIYTENWRHTAPCGVHVEGPPRDWENATVNCKGCRAKLRHIERTGNLATMPAGITELLYGSAS